MVELSANTYITKMVKQLGLEDLPCPATPLNPDVKLPKVEGNCLDEELLAIYRKIVGMIGFPAVTCRPDVAFAHKLLASHLQHPTEVHLEAAIRVVAYLNGTKTWAMTYGLVASDSFFGTADAAHNTCEKAKGTTGWAFHLRGGAVCWKSKTQALVALSSAEAEIIAVDSAVRELRFLCKLLVDFDYDVQYPVLLGQDNEAAIYIDR